MFCYDNNCTSNLINFVFNRYNKKKYLEIQAAKQSGKKGFYKKKGNLAKIVRSFSTLNVLHIPVIDSLYLK